jgi:formylmethanofuran dehydrogenase subunit E
MTIDFSQVITQEDREEKLLQEQEEEARREAIDYLNSTDWYITRFVEVGTPVPEEITNERAKARLLFQ